jgi:hypothetical protein
MTPARHGIEYTMENTLDLEEFERLSGLDFTRYVVKMKDLHIDDDFLKYFARRKNQWDDVHLELALWWLGQSGSLAAHREIANFIDHRSRSIRFLAVGFTVGMKHEVDAGIMSRVIEVLERNPDPADKEALNSVLGKPASKEAQAIAQQYFAGQRSEQ